MLSCSFVQAPNAMPSDNAPHSVATASRRSLVAGGVSILAPLASGISSASAEEKAPPKAPDNVKVSGRTGKYSDINGRWTVVFGKRINNKVVYKRDGAKYFLVFNDCGSFQITAKEAKGTCDGFAINNKGVWTFDGKEDPLVKVKPVKADEPTEPQKSEAELEKERKAADAALEEAAREEKYKMAMEAEVTTFRGRMAEEDEVVGDRLMKKFGASIVKGF